MISADRNLLVDHETYTAKDFTAARIDRFSSHGSRFMDCRFNGMRARTSFGIGLDQSEYIDCAFDGARLHMNGGGNARFVRCTFTNVRIWDWLTNGVELVDCTFSGALRRATFSGRLSEETSWTTVAN